MTLPKHTYATSQRLEVGDRAFLIPANTYISPSIMAMHTHPRYWAEPLVWKPSRWITSNTSAGAMQDEKLFAPANSAFYPWSDGPQNCPGEKFSQVEFVGVLASLMRTHSLEIVTGDGETEGNAKRRVRNVINDCDMEILLRMKDAGKARLRCVARAPA
jgi:cytochrome P450